MAETIIDGTQLNLTNIMYTSPKATDQGAKSVNILNKPTKTILRVLTPLMLTWGAGEFVNKEGVGDGKFSLGLQFPSQEYTNPDVEAFLKNMKAVEDKIKADALLYSKEWFGKVHKSAEVVDALWTPMLKYSKDKITGDYDYSKPPTLRLKIPVWENKWNIEIYDEDDNKLYPNQDSISTPLDYLKKGSNIACLIQFAGIWFVNGKFSASWKLVQAKVQKPRETIQGRCFVKLNRNDSEKLKQPQEPVEEVDNSEAAVIVDDSDEEEEVAAPVQVVQETVIEKAEEPAAATPVEEKKPVKKIVKKVKA
jgi:hypothetical protein